MSKRTIYRLITWGIFSVAAGLLCEGIIEVSVELGKVYHGRLSGPLGWTKRFFFLMPLIFARGLSLAAPIAFSAEGLFAARVEGNRRYWSVFLASLGYVGLAAIMACVCMFVLAFGSGLSIKSRELIDVIFMPLVMLWILLSPLRALSIFGFWLPSVATGLYCRLSKHPRWWLAGLLGTLTLLAGVLLWTLMGVLVGAETD